MREAHFVDEGVALIMDASGRFQHEELWKDLRRKKKKDKIHPEYYQFKTGKKEDLQNDKNEGLEVDQGSDGEFDEERLEEPDYLEKRKKELRKAFGKKIKLE